MKQHITHTSAVSPNEAQNRSVFNVSYDVCEFAREEISRNISHDYILTVLSMLSWPIYAIYCSLMIYIYMLKYISTNNNVTANH